MAFALARSTQNESLRITLHFFDDRSLDIESK
jgi:hypothetical protein